MTALLKLVRLFFYYSPRFRGKGRIFNLIYKAAAGLCRRLPENIIVRSRDGRKFRADLNDTIYKNLFFTGYYEREETLLLQDMIGHGDTVFDIGANFGWYTTLFSKLTGDEGKVYAFEPVPWIFDELKKNISLNTLPGNIILSNTALGDEEKEVEMNVFSNLPHGHASISDLGREDARKFKAHMTTLDEFAEAKGIETADLVKLDVEGAELMVLKGGLGFLSRTGPMIVFEANPETSQAFGYHPDDIIALLRDAGYTDFRTAGRKGLVCIETVQDITRSISVFCSKNGPAED